MRKRRTLRYESLADALRDAERLSNGYRRAANWSLGQICDHLGTAMRYSRNGFPSQWPKPLQALARFVAMRRIQADKIMRLRFPSPIGSPRELPALRGIEYLAEGIECFQSAGADCAPHIVFGNMSRQEWTQFHLWHCAHHLSFLIPEN